MSGCVSKETAQEGDTVFILYRGTLDDGTVFDQNVNGERPPLEVVLGQHEVIPGFENAIYGMSVNETKNVRIAPEDAYLYDPDAVVPFDRAEVESVLENLEIGQTVTYLGLYQGYIVEITDDVIVVDFNSPLVGQYLNFEITISEITKAK